MMTGDIRTSTGCSVDNLTIVLLPQFWVNQSPVKITADDDSYYAGDFAFFESLDEDNKILTYRDFNNDVKTLNYG